MYLLFYVLPVPFFRVFFFNFLSTVHGLTYNVLKLLMDADPSLFDDCSAKSRAESDRLILENEEKLQKWGQIESIYERQKSTVEFDEIPIVPSV